MNHPSARGAFAPTWVNAVAAAVASWWLAACSVAPVYQPAAAPVAAAYKEAVPAAESAQWKLAEPSDALARGDWWTVFGDARLDALQAEAAQANLSLKAGHARLAQARAIARYSEADRLPQADFGASATRSRPSPASSGLPDGARSAPHTRWRASVGASYEVDLFGRVASAVSAAQADAVQAEALQRSLLLAIQADVAQHYLVIRSLDTELALLERTVTLREEALQFAERRMRAGESSELEASRARTELSVTRAEAYGLERRRAEIEHALAVLLGKAPSELTLARTPLVFEPVAIPAGIPSALLERRPDIAAAERAMAAANARVGLARSAYFPRLTLGGSFGFESGSAGDLLKWSSRSWALGPLAGSLLSVPLFDGGRRRAAEAQAQAAYEETVALYRQSVLQAFREVEDSLAGLRLLARQAAEQQQSVAAAQRAAQLSNTRYRNGYVNHLEAIDAERTVLATQRAATQVERDRALGTVALIRALGGGWGEPQRSAQAAAAR
jgi:outer membrane protein, multidrug efflux system